MRIALLTDGIYPYVMGGMQKHSYYLVKYLSANGINVDLYHTNQSNLVISELECFTDEEKRYIRSFVVPFPFGVRYPGHYITNSYKYSRLMYNQLMRSDLPDFIYVKGFTGWYLLNQKLKGQELPVIGINFHGLEMFQGAPDILSLLRQYYLRKPVMHCLKAADYVFSYGGGISHLIQRLGISKNKIIELPAAIEQKYLSRTIQPAGGERLKFIYVGRYERRKGIKELNEAIRSIKYTHDFEFSFVGPIPDKYKINASGIHYYGVVRDQEVLFQIMKDHDVLVCPSHSEGMPNVILEAMAQGLMIIATRVGAVDLMVDIKNGFLMQKSTSEQIVRAMISTIHLRGQELIDKKYSSKEKVFHNFTWDLTISSFIKQVKHILLTNNIKDK